MSSINQHYTFQYSQPEEYRFSHDSVFLARKVYEIIQEQNLKCKSILDICAGCGVVGLDLIYHLKSGVTEADFIEVQSVYEEHFQQNQTSLQSFMSESVRMQFININYDQIKFDSKKYDLVVSNPPYFRVSQGRLSPSDFKNRCRFFLDSDLKNLLQAVSNSLQPTGHAFILLKSLDDHGISVEQEINDFDLSLSYLKLEKIRETDLYQITKKKPLLSQGLS